MKQGAFLYTDNILVQRIKNSGYTAEVIIPPFKDQMHVYDLYGSHLFFPAANWNKYFRETSI